MSIRVEYFGRIKGGWSWACAEGRLRRNYRSDKDGLWLGGKCVDPTFRILDPAGAESRVKRYFDNCNYIDMISLLGREYSRDYLIAVPMIECAEIWVFGQGIEAVVNKMGERWFFNESPCVHVLAADWDAWILRELNEAGLPVLLAGQHGKRLFSAENSLATDRAAMAS
jgi:hypothetical protein